MSTGEGRSVLPVRGTLEHIETSSLSYQDQFRRILHEITNLQWVRESLPSHSKHYAGLRQKYKKETDFKTSLYKQLQVYKQKHESESAEATSQRSNDLQNPEIRDIMQQLQLSDSKLQSLQKQLDEAEQMLNDLAENKWKLDHACEELRHLYDEVVPAICDNPEFEVEQNLKREVYQRAKEIPDMEACIHGYLAAQKELYEARDLLEKAMMVMPGAAGFLNRQTMVSRGIGSSTGLLCRPSRSLSVSLDSSTHTVREAETLAKEARQHLAQASEACNDVPCIKIPVTHKDENLESMLISYRTVKLEVESLLRTRINPRLNQLQTQLAISRYQYEQKTIEWINQQIRLLELVIRENGGLQNDSLEQEKAKLRMGSNAALIAVAAEASGRVTVDDVLEVETSELEVERNGPLPEYSEERRIYGYTELNGVDPGSISTLNEQYNAITLPAYSSHQAEPNGSTHVNTDYEGYDQPPAYTV